MRATKELIEFVEDLRKQASNVAATACNKGGYLMVDAAKLQGLMAGCRLLVEKLGPSGQTWDQMLQPPQDAGKDEFDKVSAVLDTIADSLAKGCLARVEELVAAEVLGDLVEHAEELIRARYFLAAAIILRAVLEERLRKLCFSHNCLPTAQRPTIESFKQALYSAQLVDKIVVKDIDWMAGVGNAAAHRLPEYKDEDVPQLYQRVTAFLTRFSAT